MGAITIVLPDERLSKLNEMADSFGVSSEELARASVEELLTRPDRAFQQAVHHVLLKKNVELYSRLASCAT